MKHTTVYLIAIICLLILSWLTFSHIRKTKKEDIPEVAYLDLPQIKEMG